MAGLALLAKRMPNELQSSKKSNTKLREVRRGPIPNFLSLKPGYQCPCMLGSPYEMMHLLGTSTVALGVT